MNLLDKTNAESQHAIETDSGELSEPSQGCDVDKKKQSRQASDSTRKKKRGRGLRPVEFWVHKSWPRVALKDAESRLQIPYELPITDHDR